MKVVFTKAGVFTTKGKSVMDQEMDLPDDEVNQYLQKGWLKPVGNVKIVKESESGYTPNDSQD